MPSVHLSMEDDDSATIDADARKSIETETGLSLVGTNDAADRRLAATGRLDRRWPDRIGLVPPAGSARPR